MEKNLISAYLVWSKLLEENDRLLARFKELYKLQKTNKKPEILAAFNEATINYDQNNRILETLEMHLQLEYGDNVFDRLATISEAV